VKQEHDMQRCWLRRQSGDALHAVLCAKDGAPIFDDELWALIESLLPTPKPRRKKYPGRLPVANRAALNGILFVLKTGIRWRDLSTKLGFGSGATCWRRLRDWAEGGRMEATARATLGF
jgi:transposase